jgi:hypothetical protein
MRKRKGNQEWTVKKYRLKTQEEDRQNKLKTQHRKLER